jgi:hypothetical protein
MRSIGKMGFFTFRLETVSRETGNKWAFNGQPLPLIQVLLGSEITTPRLSQTV